MATNKKRFSLYLRTILLLIWISLRICDGYSCPHGQNCDYLPAPPGETPACVRPGLTYCENPDNYPEKLIRQLLAAGQYDLRTLLIDETRDDFKATKKIKNPNGYGPNSLPSPVNANSKDYNNFNTRYKRDTNIFSHMTPLQTPTPIDPYLGYSSPGQPNYWQPDGYNHENALRNGFNNFYDGPSFYPNYEPNEWYRQEASRAGVTRYNPSEWWKYVSPSRSDVTVERSVTFPTRTTSGQKRRRRNAELLTAASTFHTDAEALRMALDFASSEISGERPRRQAVNTVALCKMEIDHVKPKAALNTKGNYMFTVNIPGNMTQLVRVEVCTTPGSTCSLCSTPRGHTSECEQKLIQKRLVALEPTGPNLKTETFWMPSCCQCTITKTGV